MMGKLSPDDPEVQKLSYELAMYEQHAKSLETKIKQIQNEINNATLTLEALKHLKKDKEVFYSIGSGMLIRGKVTDDSVVITDIGSNTLIEMDVDKAIQVVSDRLSHLKEEFQETNRVFVETVAHLEELNRRAREMLKDIKE